jgi:hypothetical protein
MNTKLQEVSITRPTRTYYAIQDLQVLQNQDNPDLYGRRNREDSNTDPSLLKPEDINQDQLLRYLSSNRRRLIHKVKANTLNPINGYKSFALVQGQP